MSEPVTILGAGIVGICCALSLAERGVAVRLLDRGAPGQETSSGNAGVISPWSIVPQALPGLWKSIPGLMWGANRPLAVRAAYWPRMALWGLRFLGHGTEAQARRAADAMQLLCGPSIDLFRRHLEGTGSEHLVRDCAYVHAFRDGSRARLDSLDYRIRRDKGAPIELVGADELRRIEPVLSRDFQAAVLIHGQARATSPGRIGETLARKAAQRGVEIVRGNVQSLRPARDGWIIGTDVGELVAPQVVVAMGAWTAGLLRPLGILVPLAAERGYHVEFRDPGIGLDNSVMDVDAKVVASSMETGLRVAGHAEFGAVDALPDTRRERLLLRQARAAFPGLTDSGPKFWMGRRPSFPDSLPMIGEFERHPGLYAAFGHSHYGLMMAPKTGELVAGLLTGQTANADLTPFRTGRFRDRSGAATRLSDA